MCTHPHKSDITTTCLQSVLRGTHSMRCWGGEESQPMILLCFILNTILIITLLQFTIRTWPLICAAVQANGGIERAVLDAYCWMYSSWNIPQEYKGACTGGDQVRQWGVMSHLLDQIKIEIFHSILFLSFSFWIFGPKIATFYKKIFSDIFFFKIYYSVRTHNWQFLTKVLFLL